MAFREVIQPVTRVWEAMEGKNPYENLLTSSLREDALHTLPRQGSYRALISRIYLYTNAYLIGLS